MAGIWCQDCNGLKSMTRRFAKVNGVSIAHHFQGEGPPVAIPRLYCSRIPPIARSFPSARNYGRTKIMKKSIKVKPKRGRPPSGGRDPLMGFRASPLLRASIVKWAENHPDEPSLSEAVRRLVELGLEKAPPAKQKSNLALNAMRAAELAAKIIDGKIAPETDR
jgi:hypothetical protein